MSFASERQKLREKRNLTGSNILPGNQTPTEASSGNSFAEQRQKLRKNRKQTDTTVKEPVSSVKNNIFSDIPGLSKLQEVNVLRSLAAKPLAHEEDEYTALMRNEDFAVRSKTGMDSYNQSKQAQQQGNQKSFWEVLLETNANAYAAQNENPAVVAMNNTVRNYREDTSYREPSDEWTQEQKDIFGYLYSDTPAKAFDYAEKVNNAISKEKADAQRESVAQSATGSFGAGLGNTAAALLAAPTAIADFMDNVAEFAGRGTVTQKDTLTPYDYSQAVTGGISEKLNEYGTIDEKVPVVGGRGLGDLYGLGFSAAQSLMAGGVGKAAGTSVLTLTQFFGQAAAAGVDEQLDAGGTAGQAMLYGLVSGAAEAVAEKIGIDNLFSNSGAKTLKSLLGNMVKQGIAEGMEEGVTSIIDSFADRLIMGDKSKYSKSVAEYSKAMSGEEAKKKAFGDILEDIAFDVLGGMITGSADTAVMTAGRAVSNTKQGKNALSGLTKNEQAVVDKVYKDRVADAEKDGKVSQKRKNEIYDQVLEDMEKGYISTGTIEEVLGGDTYKSYRDTVDSEDALTKQEKELSEEFNGLNKMVWQEMTGEQHDRREELRTQLKDLRAKIEDNKKTSSRDQLKTQLSQEVSEMVKSDRLAESYNERGRKGQAFQADVSQYDAKQRATVQAAIDSGVLNNTNRAHEFVDLVAKLSADKGVPFNFADNKKLRESGFALEGVTVNGFVNENGVTVNVNSAKALNSVVGHEITHVLEGTELYDALAQTITEYAKGKGDYDTRLENLTKLYEGKEGYTGEDAQVKIEQEVVADLVGDYLFTDKDFVSRLSAENRNVFQKIYDEVKYLCRVATAGSKEARQLEKVKKIFEDAYRGETKNPTGDGGARYSLGNITDSNGNSYGVGVHLDSTLLDNLTPSERVGMVKEYVKELGGETFTAYDQNGNAVDITIAKSNDKFKNQNGKRVSATKDLTNKRINNEVKQESIALIDELITAAEYDTSSAARYPHGWLDNNGQNDWEYWTTYIQDKNNTIWEATLNVANSANGEKILYDISPIKKVGRAIKLATLPTDSSVPQGTPTVNNQNSLSPEGQTDTDSPFPLPWQIKGGDVAFPMPEDIAQLEAQKQSGGTVSQMESVAQDGYQEQGQEVVDGAQGAVSEEAAAQNTEGGDTPITTVKERLEAKQRALQTELSENQRLREESAANLDAKIAKLQAEYDGKKNKDTKYANNLLRRIENLKRRKASIDADYAKRISDIEAQSKKVAEQIPLDHSRQDKIDRDIARIDKMLEYDKTALDEEFAQRREELQDKNRYISAEAGKLYEELRSLKKGVKASDQLGQLLDSGYDRSAIRAALVNIKHTPGETVNIHSEAESLAREMLAESYENAGYDLEKEYRSRMDKLEQDAEEKRKAARVANQRRIKQQEYDSEMEELIGDTSTWVDKKWGLSYQMNTLRRNLRDVVRDSEGNRDIPKADAIYDVLQGSYNRNEAELNREATRIKQPYADMKITKYEDAYIQMLGELRHNPDTTLTPEEVDEYYEAHKKHIDKAKVDEAIDMARKTYDELFARVNEALREQGMKEIPYRQGYFPHFTEDKQGILGKIFNWKTNNNEIPTDIAGLTEQFNPNRSYQSFNKQRKTDTTDYSFTKGMDTYVQGALDWIYHIEDIQKRRAFENRIRYVHSEKGIQEKIDAIRANTEYDADEAQEQIDLVLKEAGNPLNNFVTDLRTGTNLLAGKKHSMDRAMEGKSNRNAYSVMTNISNRVSANMVGGSISAALTNFIPITQSWSQVSPVSSLRAMVDTIRSTFRDDGTVDKSDFLTNRLRKADNLYKSGWDKASEKVGFLMEAVDSFTSQTVWRSKYIQNMNAGMSESEAIRNADQFAENVMAGRSRGNMPTFFEEKNPISKVFTAFQLEVANQYGYMLKDMPQDMKNEATGKLVMGYAKMFIGAYVYNALYSSLTGRDAAFDPIGILTDLLKDLGFGGDDDDEDEEKDLVGAGKNLLDNILEEVPFVGGLMGGGRIPISSMLPYDNPYDMVVNTAEGVSEILENWGDWEATEATRKELTNEWLNPVYYLAFPMGGGQIRKTTQGLSMYSDEFPLPGSYTSGGDLRFPVSDDIGSKLQSTLFGQWASENAQQYIEEGRSPLSKKQTQELMDTGMTIQDYWDYRDGLKALDKASESGTAKLSEKADYIDSLDLTVEQKNILINNIADREDPIDMTDYRKYGSFEEFDYASQNPEKYAFLENEGIGYLGYKDLDGETKDSWNWAFKHQEEYRYLKENGVNPEDYSVYQIPMLDFDDEGDKAYQWAFDNQEKAELGNVFNGGVVEYRKYCSEINAITADKDENGKAISGSRQDKVAEYINGLDLEYGEKIILYVSEYKESRETYKYEIVDYLNSRSDISYSQTETILTELGFKVSADGKVTVD